MHSRRAIHSMPGDDRRKFSAVHVAYEETSNPIPLETYLQHLHLHAHLPWSLRDSARECRCDIQQRRNQ